MQVNKEIDQTVRMIGLISSSKSGGELCRRLATDEFFGVGTLGVQLYALTNTGRWQKLGSYGKDPFGGVSLSQLDENLLTQAARTKEVAIGSAEIDDQEADVLACVALRGDLPIGALVRSSGMGGYTFMPDNGTLKAIQDTCGLFLDSIGYKTVSNDQHASQASPEDITERQMAILIEMALGKTNLFIGKKLLLSESTIKQESVKLFRALGIGTRRQAVLKARTLGLLPEDLEIVI